MTRSCVRRVAGSFAEAVFSCERARMGGSVRYGRRAALIAAAVCVFALGSVAAPAKAGRLQDAAWRVFGNRAPVALCIAHYESTDGRFLYNGSNLGPWQVNVAAHRWVDRRRVVTDFFYAATVAYTISRGGRDWRPWSVHRLCGV